ncbi:hypothetical protein [Aquitalea denitrificans]|uniref:hypothetical protein n=1 Tax=Aquitalea denitrificans TaxID=519081 RepID=UPI00135BF8BB|nr:hypothetical protein [Aquitalea denitrificans]
MTDFLKIIQTTLQDINSGFETAKNDLNNVVESINEAVLKTSARSFSMYTRPLTESPKGDIYRVYFDTDTEDSDAEVMTIMDFMIYPKGYPIDMGSYRKQTGAFSPIKRLANRSDLEEFFAAALSDPESSIIQAIGFGMRKYRNAMDMDDEIPF